MEKSQGKKLLVPLTNSLYVDGELAETDKVIVDIGTGYYAEKVCDALTLDYSPSSRLLQAKGRVYQAKFNEAGGNSQPEKRAEKRYGNRLIS